MNTETKKTAPIALTLAQLEDALNAANRAYIAREQNPVLNKHGIQKDIARAYNDVRGFTEAQLREIAKMGLNETFLQGLRDATSTKKPMRIAQTLKFCLTHDANLLKGSVKTFLLEYLGILVCGAKTREGMRFCATGKGDEHTSDQVRNTANARKLFTALNPVGIGSESTQNSVSFSKGGIAESLQMGSKPGSRAIPELNEKSPLIKRLNVWVEGLTDGSIALIAAQSKGRTAK